MARGKAAEIGDTRTAKNGYHYTKVKDRGWVLTHWLTAEKVLGRLLEDNESVRFKEPKFKHDPYNEDGIVIVKKKTATLRKRRAQIEARMQELQAELNHINQQLGEH